MLWKNKKKKQDKFVKYQASSGSRFIITVTTTAQGYMHNHSANVTNHIK